MNVTSSDISFTIFTPRLILRKFTMQDASDMLQNWLNDQSVQSMLEYPVYSTLSDVKNLISTWLKRHEEESIYRWAIIEKSSNSCIGMIGYCRVFHYCKTAELECCLGRKYWGSHYANEALEAVINFTFNHTIFNKLEAYHVLSNKKSESVLQKSSMKLTDNIQRHIEQGETPTDKKCYAITKEEFFQNN